MLTHCDDVPIGAYNVNTPNASLVMQAVETRPITPRVSDAGWQEPLQYVLDIVREFPSPIKNTSQASPPLPTAVCRCPPESLLTSALLRGA